MSQATLSAVIRSLEEELEQKLFDRSTRSVSLTEFGAYFLPEAEDAYTYVQRTFEAARDGPHTKRISVGFNVQTAVHNEAWDLLQKRFEGLRIELRLMQTRDQLASLKSRQLDVAMISGDCNDVELESCVIGSDEWIALLPVGHPLSAGRALTLAKAATEPVVIWPRSDSPINYDLIVEALQNGSPSPLTLRETLTPMSQIAAVRNGEGIGVLPSHRVMRDLMTIGEPEASSAGIVTLPISDAPPAVQSAVWRRGDMSPEIRAFVEGLGP